MCFTKIAFSRHFYIFGNNWSFVNLLGKYFTFLLSTLFIVSACEKRLFDYRNKYVGNYKFTYQEQSVNGCIYNLGPVEPGEYQGKIYYDRKEDGKAGLHISFVSNITVAVLVNKDGSLGGECGSFTGKFQGRNTVNFTLLDPCFSHCSFTSYTVTGQKIE
jgi:hypothetical protein